jgi:hypothetical protein
MVIQDNGSEITELGFNECARSQTIHLNFTCLSKSNDTDSVERFHGRILDECLLNGRFATLKDVQKVAENPTDKCGNFGPHSALNDGGY